MIAVGTLMKQQRPQPCEALILGVNKKTSQLIIFTQAILVLWTIISAVTHAGAISAGIITYLLYTTYILYAFVSKNALFVKLIVFGSVCGIMELFADHYAVVSLGSLIYPKGGPMLWSSPLYMPLACANILVQMGYVSLRLVQWKGVAVSTVIMTFLGVLYVFIFENMAIGAGWWYYDNTSLLFSTPYYVVFAELFLFFILPAFVHVLYNKKTVWSVVFGTVAGIWILFAVIIVHALVP